MNWNFSKMNFQSRWLRSYFCFNFTRIESKTSSIACKKIVACDEKSSTIFSSIYRFESHSRERQKVDICHSCKTNARKSFEHRWTWVAFSFLHDWYCVFLSNVFSLRVCVCWIFIAYNIFTTIFNVDWKIKNEKIVDKSVDLSWITNV